MKFDKKLPQIVCDGHDWVRCYQDECTVTPQALMSIMSIKCLYYDIIYESDRHYSVSSKATKVTGNGIYWLKASDHVKVKCTGTHLRNSSVSTTQSILPSKWTGILTGFRSTVIPPPPPPGREDTLNVLIFGFDSTARNGFIRKMPESYKYLKDVLKATFLTRYNIVGDGTPASLFPILTGKTELEWPEARKSMGKNFMDHTNFIFHRVKQDGYRTAYFEDQPSIGTFQYRFNGFAKQPADHYLRDFYLEVDKMRKHSNKYCVGDTPQYKLMMNITEQFFKMDAKKFCFTFIADITHDDFNQITSADKEFVSFLRQFKEDGRLQNTLLFVFGDHGPRYLNVRATYQGKLEERLPLMGIVLPEKLLAERPEVKAALQSNIDVLTTPHDVYATVLDAIGMTEHWNPFKVKGADLPRGMTLFEPIPRNRSCSEAAIEAHWCACHRWITVPPSDPMHRRAADALVNHINSLTESARSQCAPRAVISVAYVAQRAPNTRMLAFAGARDADGYVGKFGAADADKKTTTYQLQLDVSPGKGTYEASMTYVKAEDKFVVNTRDISRINAYGNQPSCISDRFPHLNKYCYCNNYSGD
ncbi:uncharacterized protein LOC113228760 isoform X2 [Hyposmocoma kahamanoa]|uniref:uncharacterized protein LOC113228760 isoform X2 n=1 Tax=Hyposmocoma kahamanoa TaxID=1477025 RepID=UPI000E6D76C8|nr:uncharacterized protein LOC113228760 isoform X2 [Hyposmocoma kahamanoa]